MPPKKKVSRSAETGEFVSAEEAEANPGTTVTETIEAPDNTAAILAFQKPEPKEPTEEERHVNPLLKVWRDVLAPAGLESKKRVTAQYANRIVQTYPQIGYKDMPKFQALYYSLLDELLVILLDEIKTDDQCLIYSNTDDDREFNSVHYKQLLLDWQIRFMEWEVNWRCEDDDAAIQLGAFSEVHKMFFSDRGLVPHLDTIKFEYTEADQLELQQALEATKEAGGE